MYLLDTNVISELRKAKQNKANPAVVDWASGIPSQQLYLSTITILEIDIGILAVERKDARQGSALRHWLEQQIIPAFEHRILDITLPVCRYCALLHVPNRRSDRDAFIAATGLAYNMTVVTRNIADFKDTGVKLINPWDL